MIENQTVGVRVKKDRANRTMCHHVTESNDMKHRLIHALFLSWALFAFVSDALVAQSVGDRVRVTASTGPSLVGEVTRIDGAGITIDMGEQLGSRQIPSSDIEAIERSVGTKNRARPGAVIGALAGVGVAAAKGYAGFEVGGVAVTEADNRSLGRALALMAGGTLVGLGLGAAIKAERWEGIAIGDQVSLHPALDAGAGRYGEAPALFLGTRIRF